MSDEQPDLLAKPEETDAAFSPPVAYEYHVATSAQYGGLNALAAPEGPASLLSAIVQLAKDPQVDVAKLQALLGMQERMEERQAEIEFNRALARLPAMHVKKNGLIDLTSKEDKAANRTRKLVPFAKWEDIAAIIEPMLEAEGFRLMFDTAPRPGEGGGLIITGKLLHKDGHSKTASMPLALDTGPGRNNLQAMGSTLSYGKRYCAEMLLNVVREGEDDDGKKGGAQYLTEEQQEQLAGKIAEAKINTGQFLATHTNGPAHGLDEVDQTDFVRLMNLIDQIVKRRAKE